MSAGADKRVVVLAGDGIGPEVVAEARAVVDAAAARVGLRVCYDEQLIGGVAIDATGEALPERTLDACRDADAVLLGAVGGPKWDDPNAPVRPEQGLLGLRKGLGLFANLRPVRAHPALLDASPLRPERLSGVDLLVVRELTGGIYFGTPRLLEAVPGGGTRALDTMVYTDAEVRRVVALACRLAAGRRGRVTSVDKANVLESSRLWRRVATEVAAAHPAVELDHLLVDAAAMRLITSAAGFDVVVTSNMFGDILTDEASVLTGSIGMLPSASLGARGPGLYEPIHGSAPDIAGRGLANPLGAILSAAMMLRHSLDCPAGAALIERAVDDCVQAGARTADLGGSLGTAEMGAAVREALARVPAQ
ncbi:3-isopropylmalate dehydrogenase [Haliangium sp.]|uniref:3-isopropylmalate dehydrogenase n=1 Tax=Haliangium sp. TaxID=2663208 RepID=UPI003D0F8934